MALKLLQFIAGLKNQLREEVLVEIWQETFQRWKGKIPTSQIFVFAYLEALEAIEGDCNCFCDDCGRVRNINEAKAEQAKATWPVAFRAGQEAFLSDHTLEEMFSVARKEGMQGVVDWVSNAMANGTLTSHNWQAFLKENGLEG